MFVPEDTQTFQLNSPDLLLLPPFSAYLCIPGVTLSGDILGAQCCCFLPAPFPSARGQHRHPLLTGPHGMPVVPQDAWGYHWEDMGQRRRKPFDRSQWSRSQAGRRVARQKLAPSKQHTPGQAQSSSSSGELSTTMPGMKISPCSKQNPFLPLPTAPGNKQQARD